MQINPLIIPHRIVFMRFILLFSPFAQFNWWFGLCNFLWLTVREISRKMLVVVGGDMNNPNHRLNCAFVLWRKFLILR